MAASERVSVAGRVVERRTRHKKDGSPFVVCVIETATGSTVDCVWWDPMLAPSKGSEVSVQGTKMNNGSVSVTASRVKTTSGTPRAWEHRILDYYRDCIEAEFAQDRDLTVNSRLVYSVSDGPSMLLTGSHVFQPDPLSRRWTDARRQAGDAESVYVGFPIVTEQDARNGRIAPVFMAEVTMAVSGETVTAKLHSATIELNPNALRMLGLREEIDDVLGRFDELDVATSPDDRLLVVMQFAASEGWWHRSELDPTKLNEIAGGRKVHNTQIFMARPGGQEVMSRALLQDIGALTQGPIGALREGPLGVLFGHVDPGEAGELAPTPAVLQTNLHQEMAVNATTVATLTVITGPPGTGKTQVLVNAVAAAIDRGDSVLLASKNNHAIDVVVERILSTHEAAVPIRVGRAELRELAGQTMSSALAEAAVRTPIEETNIDGARSHWATAYESADRPYKAIRRRSALERQIGEQENRIDELASSLPERLRSVDLAELPDREYLVAAYGAADRMLTDSDGLPTRWFWQRRRAKHAAEEAAELVSKTCALVGSRAQPELTKSLLEAGPRATLDLVGRHIQLFAETEALQSLQGEFGLIPSESELEQELAEGFDSRRPAALELFAANWRRRRRPGAPSLAAARAVQSQLLGGKSLPRVTTESDFRTATEVFPVWCTTSLSAGSNLPLSAGLFDLLIIDEAAQSDLPSAIPLLFRAKRVAVVGDPHQLDHISTLSEKADDALADRHGLTTQQRAEFGYKDTSLYALAARRVRGEPVLLNRHFRSHRDIIGFSNEAFYGGQLVIETGPNPPTMGPALVWVDVRGDFERDRRGRSALNRSEAGEVLGVLADLWEHLGPSGASIGVVSPFRAHVDFLKQLIADNRRDLLDVVTVDTAHGFQGDERDIMVFSTVLTPSMPTGLVHHAGQPNLVNVSVTRAKSKLVIVGDRRACLESGGALAGLARYSQSFD